MVTSLSRVKYPEVEHFRSADLDTTDYIVHVQEKRDGSNISVWYDGIRAMISSRGREFAAPDLRETFMKTEDGQKLIKLIEKTKTTRVFFGELIPEGFGPTKIEGYNNKPEYVIFDIYDRELGGLLPPEKVKEICEELGVRMVETWAVLEGKTQEEIMASAEELVNAHPKREGAVLKLVKTNGNRIEYVFKVKHKAEQLPDEKKHKAQAVTFPTGPEIPEEKIQRAILNCFYTEFGGDLERFKDKKAAMPLVARYVQIECDEHGYKMPYRKSKIYEAWTAFIANPALSSNHSYSKSE